MRLVTATLVVFGLLWGAEASNDGVEKVEESGLAPGAIDRIIELIQGMKTEIIADGKLEQQLFDKFQCWTERAVNKANNDIAGAETALQEAEENINQLASQIAQLTEDIAHKNKNLAANRKSQKDATEQRSEQEADYEAELNNDMAKLGALEKTLEILQGNKASTDHQVDDDNMALMSKNMKIIMRGVVSDDSISADDKQAFANLAKAPAQFFQSKAGRVKAHESQTGPIIGIMKSMLLATASDAQDRSANEIRQTTAYQKLMQTLEDEEDSLENQISEFETSKATAEKDMADAKKSQADNEKLHEEETAFKEATVEAGKEKAKEWALRSQLRLEELKNIDKGIDILSDIGGENQAFNKPGDGAFLQIETTNKLRKIQRQLAEIAMETGSKDVTKLVSVSTQGAQKWQDAMWKIREMIQRMIQSHKDQAAHDRQLRQECLNHATQLESEAQALANAASRAESDAEALQGKMDENTSTMNDLEDKIENDQTTLSDLTEAAEQATTKMRKDLGARENAINKIQQAIEVLGAHCKANSFVQKPEEGQYANDPKAAPKAEFSGANKHCQSTNGLISIMQMVLQDLHNESEELRSELGVTAAETDKQKKDMEAAIRTASEQVADLEAQNGDMNQDKVAAQDLQKSKEAAKGTTMGMKKTSVGNCAPVVEEFDARQADRETEVEALNYALTVLTSGASGNAGNEFLQVRVARH